MARDKAYNVCMEIPCDSESHARVVRRELERVNAVAVGGGPTFQNIDFYYHDGEGWMVQAWHREPGRDIRVIGIREGCDVHFDCTGGHELEYPARVQ